MQPCSSTPSSSAGKRLLGHAEPGAHSRALRAVCLGRLAVRLDSLRQQVDQKWSRPMLFL